MERFWEPASKAPPEHFASFPDLERLVVQVLYNRGIRTKDAVESFLGRRVAGDDPFQMQGMKRAVRRIRLAIQRGERIAVYGDFDADGVTSTAVLVEALHALGAHVAPYIPNRVDEGYGLSAKGLNKIAAKGVSLVITVDCGIRAAEEVEHATRLGLDVIVTDHHALPPVLPNAFAVVNPKQRDESYAFTEFAGVGLAFKLAQALILAHETAPAGQPRAEIAPDDLLDLVALGTVADLAPLLGENRVLVSRGLPALNPPRRPGLRQLLASARLRSDVVDCETISFFLGPRLNAAGRIEHAEIAYRLLWAPDDGAAAELARKLEE
ncbi:MAG TPA: DHH family phosphoesterase, partial [Ardenticatenaceae bacterium]|nr:DHH family phosphoesterase [Ardenticatenaceae bacterium]